MQILETRSDTTEVPSITVELPPVSKKSPIKNATAPTKSPISHLSERFKNNKTNGIKQELQYDDDVYEKVRQELQEEREQYAMETEHVKDMSVGGILINSTIKEELDSNIFECKIGKLVQKSVNHIFNDKKKVFAKTVFIANDKFTSDVKCLTLDSGREEVLNLCVKEGRKSHGRKQSAPRRITYCTFNDGKI